jgi:predicted transposase/invertase (TIGR01784 family)
LAKAVASCSRAARTDKLFYRIFLAQPGLISELLPDIPADCQFDYTAPVVKEREIRLDGLLTPVSDDLSLPLVFLEAQMQRDPGFYGRFFAGIFLYLQQYASPRPWRGLLVLQRRSQDLGPEAPYQLALDYWVQRVYLEDLLPLTDLSPNLALLRLLVVPEEQAGAAARAILNQSESEEQFRQWLDLVEAILVYKLPRLGIEEVRQMLDLREATLQQTQFYQEVLQEGRREGRQEGIQEGIQQGEADLVLRQLARRCGVLSEIQQARVRVLSRKQLELLGEALLDFGEMMDLERWLQDAEV